MLIYQGKIYLNLQYDTVIWENQVYFTTENEEQSAHKLIFFQQKWDSTKNLPIFATKIPFFSGKVGFLRAFRHVFRDLKDPPLQRRPRCVPNGVLGVAGPVEATEDLVRDPGPGAEEREVKNHAWPVEKLDGNHSLIYI